MTIALTWVVLTQGERTDELVAALASLNAGGHSESEVVVVHNGGAGCESAQVRNIRSERNLGVPGGRDFAITKTETPIIGFLDDDARLLSVDAASVVLDAFDRDPDLGAISFQISSEDGTSSRRHVPRIGGGSADRSGRVATFLGGACAIRRTAYVEAGGYWTDLFYAHEELDLSWRLHDLGYHVSYDPTIKVYHPRTPISRHPDGWRLTGRNRVMVARRNLPWIVALAHVAIWLVGGLLRAPTWQCAGAYARGWWTGWFQDVDRRPISWSTILRLARAGRPPIV